MVWTSPNFGVIHVKRILSTVAILSLAFALSGCKSDEEKAVAVFESLGAAAEANKDDCDKMGDAFKGIIDSSADLIKKLKDKEGKQTDEEKKAFKEKYEPRMKAAMEKMIKPAMKCATNEKVKAAMKAM